MRSRLLAAIPATALAVGMLAAAAPASAVQGYKWQFHYSSLAKCSQEMDRYAQRHTIVQGCTPDAFLNGKPNRWRLMVG